jgi:Flp pilus assembly protein TadD
MQGGLWSRIRLVAIVAAIAFGGAQCAWAKDLKITVPRHSQPTPVQRLNREGVDAVRKQQFEKAEALFLKAYLYDPADPFTLNNLGYISELQGKLDRALRFYELAAEQGTDAGIDRSSAKQLEGKPIEYALNGVKDAPLRVNHMNVEAIQLLSENRNAEAGRVLQQALAADPNNSFTLNNLGVARESLGDYDGAVKYYDQAAAASSSEPVVVTLDRSWRGKPVSRLAAESARRLKQRLKEANTPEAQAALLAIRGVSATNENNWKAAREDFLKAYSLNPASAISLNNLGYVSERDGDVETAHFFYSKALHGDNPDARVGLATQPEAEGKHLVAVAGESDQKVNAEIDLLRRARRAQPGDVELEHRDGTLVKDAAPPAAPAPQSDQNQNPSQPEPELVPRDAVPATPPHSK